MRTILAPLLLLLPALAGCIAPEPADPVAPAAEETISQESTGREEPAPEREPGGTSQTAATEPEQPAEAPAAPSIATMPLSFEGKTQTFVCIPSALPRCGAALPSETERYVPEFEGEPRSAHVVLTWTAASPLTETLVLHIEGVAGCDEPCHAMGTSPLELRVDDITLADDWELTIHAFVPCQVCDGHDKMVDPGQEFAVSGELAYAPDRSDAE